MPKKEFEEITVQVQRLMGAFFRDLEPLMYQPERVFHPPMDIYETADDLVVIMEISGMRAEEIRIVIDRDLLSISGVRTEPPSPAKVRLHQMEIDFGVFGRTLRIPFPVDGDEIKATYREGFLSITVPKVKKETVSRKVEVCVS